MNVKEQAAIQQRIAQRTKKLKSLHNYLTLLKDDYELMRDNAAALAAADPDGYATRCVDTILGRGNKTAVTFLVECVHKRLHPHYMRRVWKEEVKKLSAEQHADRGLLYDPYGAISRKKLRKKKFRDSQKPGCRGEQL